jgi:2-methylcitrate dehydratase PrpD
MNNSVTKTLIEFLLTMKFEDLPAEVISSTKRVILDTIGATLAGVPTDIGRIFNSLVRDSGGRPESTIIGSGEKNSCLNAAMVNAKIANALDCDDTFLNYSHLSSVSVLSALSMAEREHACGKDLLLAVALAYELTARVGSSFILPAGARGGGLSWLIIGSIVPTIKLLKLGLDKALNAVGIGCSNAPVPSARKSCSIPVSMVKYADMGIIAYTGMLSALLAQKGYTGSKTVFEGEDGFWKMSGAEDCDYELMVRELGSKWYIPEASFKLYPCCRWIHIPLDLTKKIMHEQKLRFEDIDEVTLRVNPFIKRVAAVGMPEDGINAQFSLGYNLALLCLGVEPSGEWQTTKWLKNKKVEAFIKRVSIEDDPDAAGIINETKPEHLGFRKTSASVTIKAKGNIFSERGEYAKGDPWTEETRLSDEELINKFKRFTIGLSSASKSWEQKVERMIDLIFNLERINNLNDLTSLFKINDLLLR